MDKMVEVIVALGVAFILLPGIIITNYQSALDATSDGDVETILYLMLVLGLIGLALGLWSKAKNA